MQQRGSGGTREGALGTCKQAHHRAAPFHRLLHSGAKFLCHPGSYQVQGGALPVAVGNGPYQLFKGGGGKFPGKGELGQVTAEPGIGGSGLGRKTSQVPAAGL